MALFGTQNAAILSNWQLSVQRASFDLSFACRPEMQSLQRASRMLTKINALMLASFSSCRLALVPKCWVHRAIGSGKHFEWLCTKAGRVIGKECGGNRWSWDLALQPCILDKFGGGVFFSLSLQRETGQLSLAHVNVWTAWAWAGWTLAFWQNRSSRVRWCASLVFKIRTLASATGTGWLRKWATHSEHTLHRTSLEELTTFRRQVFSHYPNVEAGPIICKKVYRFGIAMCKQDCSKAPAVFTGMLCSACAERCVFDGAQWATVSWRWLLSCKSDQKRFERLVSYHFQTSSHPPLDPLTASGWLHEGPQDVFREYIRILPPLDQDSLNETHSE